MKPNPSRRYSFLRVSVVVICFYGLLAILAMIIIAVAPNISTDSFPKLFSWRNILNQLISMAFSCGFYYFMINRYYRLLYDRQKTPAFVLPTLAAFGILAVYYILYQLLLSENILNVTMNGQMQPINRAMFIINYSVSAVFFVAISFLVAYLTNLLDDRKQKKILEEQALQLEAEKSYANFNFLKAQINPHFLHNTLNFLYARALPYSEELSEGILTLSEIMRYALSQNTAVDSKVPLTDELEHLRNVIRINQLRYSNQLKIDFQTKGDMSTARIVPFVLITLVENAFKHGDLTHPDHPLSLYLEVKDNLIYFYCMNKKKTGLKELSTGIGLENIKKRLALSYGKEFCLDVNETTQLYTTELKIFKV